MIMCDSASGQLVCSVKLGQRTQKLDMEISEDERKTKLGSPKKAAMNASTKRGQRGGNIESISFNKGDDAEDS